MSLSLEVFDRLRLGLLLNNRFAGLRRKPKPVETLDFTTQLENPDYSVEFVYHGDIGFPGMDIPGLDEGEKVIAIFNAGGSDGIAVSRVMTDKFPHVEGKPDKTRKFLVTTHKMGDNGEFVIRYLHTVEPQSLMTPEQIKTGYNLEDMRFQEYGSNLLVGSLTAATEEGIPYLGIVLTSKMEKDGEVERLEFGKVHLLKDENGDIIEGKNGIPYAILGNGEVVIAYRPEILSDGSVNANVIRFVKWDPANPDKNTEFLGEQEIPLIEGYTRYGWNGATAANAVPFESDILREMYGEENFPAWKNYVLQEMHGIENVSGDNGDSFVKYNLLMSVWELDYSGVPKLVGVITKPVLTYEQGNKTTGGKSNMEGELNIHKLVIYVPHDENIGDRRVSAITTGDERWGLISRSITDIRNFSRYHISQGNFLRAGK